MAVTETISIVNKSGKLVSTSKHIVNIFKEAKDAYQEKKAEIRAGQQLRLEDRTVRKLRDLRIEDVKSVDSGRSPRQRSRRNHEGPEEGARHMALTEENLSQVGSTASAATSQHGSPHGSRHGSQRGTRSPGSPSSQYRSPQSAGYGEPRLELMRRHTDMVPDPRRPPPFAPPKRSYSSPNMEEEIDMNLAYGDIPPPLPLQPRPSVERELELQGLMSKLDRLMLEAECIQHTATTIIASLQKNPEAMAAVALTLAEVSKVLARMGPGVLTALKSGSPAIFALLISPEFLIAGGVAVGVTIVIFGGYRIIKRIQDTAAERRDAGRMDEALVYEPAADLGSIEGWRRGIAEVEAQSVATSVDGEFITPEAARIRKERIRERAREERRDSRPSLAMAPAPAPARTSRRESREETTRAPTRRKEGSRSLRAEVETAISEDGGSRRGSVGGKSRKESRSGSGSGSGRGNGEEEKTRKSSNTSALAMMFRKKTEKARVEAHRPKLLEM